MRPLPPTLLPAFLLAALTALSPAASAMPVPDKIDSRAIVVFVVGVGPETKTFVADGAGGEPLEQLIRAWIGREGNKDDVAVLDSVVRSPRLQPQLRALLSPWTADNRKLKRVNLVRDTEAFLNDAVAKSRQVLDDPRNKAEIDAAINANYDAPAVPDPRQTVDRAKKIREQQHGDKGVFGRDRDPGEPGSGGDGRPEGGQPQSPTPPLPTPPGGVKTQAQIQALVDDLNAVERTQRGGPKLNAGEIPLGGTMNSLADDTLAPGPSLWARGSSMWYSDEATVMQDVATIRAGLQDVELPKVAAINEGASGAIQDFFLWLRNVKVEDMPSVDYANLPKGVIGTYDMGWGLGKGSITINHAVRFEPPRARSAVLVHELYHYWDKRVAKNYYPNVSYGKIGAGTERNHEYDAYMAGALYWNLVKQEGDSGALARFMDRLPTEADQVRQVVNGAVK